MVASGYGIFCGGRVMKILWSYIVVMVAQLWGAELTSGCKAIKNLTELYALTGFERVILMLCEFYF